MGIVTRLLEMKSVSAGISKPDAWLVNFLMGSTAKSGAVVNESTALNCMAVYACVKVLAETLSSLPFFVYERDGESKNRARNHPLYEILHTQPNPEMSSMTFRETLQGHLCLWGNAYAEIEWNNGGYVKGLWPLRPDKTIPFRDDKTKKIFYRIDIPNGPQAVLPADNVLHLRGFSFNGLLGYSVVRLMREAIGLALSTEEYGARFFSNSASPSGVLQTGGKLSDTAYERLKKDWMDKHQGLDNAQRIAILEEGMQWQQIGIPPEDAQFLETRKFQKAEIAGGFRIPPHLIGDLEKATFSNIEHQGIEFVVHTMRPWLVRWEQECNIKLLSPLERQRFYSEFLVDGLLRGDTQSRYAAYAVGRQWGWLSADDIRSLENLNPLPNNQGKTYIVPLNMQDASALGGADDNNNSGIRLLRADFSAGFKTRKRMATAYRKIFYDMAERILKREEADIMRAASRFAAKNDTAGLEKWIGEFYDNHPEYVNKVSAPVFASYAETVAPLAAEEAGAQFGDQEHIETFVRAYLDVFISKHIFSSRGQLLSLIEDSLPGTLVETLQKRFDEWKEKRAGHIADVQAIRANNAVAKEVWKLVGVSQVRWVRQDKLPFCAKLDGTVASINGFFLRQGDKIEVAGKAFTARGDIGHPPLTENCRCFIAPVI